MAFFNYFFQLGCFLDKKPSNNPSLTNFKWVRDIEGVPVDNPASNVFTLAPSASLTVFSSASKKFVYIEADNAVNLTINGIAGLSISPIVINTSTLPGSFFLNSSVTALILTNPSSTDAVNIFVASAE